MRFSTTMTPKWVGSTWRRWTSGRKMGKVMIMTAIPSMNMPRTRRIRLTMRRITHGVDERARMALMMAFGICCRMRTQPNGAAAAMMNITCTVCLALSHRTPKTARTSMGLLPGGVHQLRPCGPGLLAQHLDALDHPHRGQVDGMAKVGRVREARLHGGLRPRRTGHADVPASGPSHPEASNDRGGRPIAEAQGPDTFRLHSPG